MDMFCIVAIVVYILGVFVNYGLFLAWWNATVIASPKETREFKKELALHSLGSWLCVCGTLPAVSYGKFGIRFR